MLKKVEKSFDNLFGVKSDDGKELYDKPLLMCFFPDKSNIRDINGYINKILYLLQIRHLGTTESDYDLDSIPFNVGVNTRSTLIQNEVHFEDQFIKLIPENDINKAKELMHNITLLSFCAGHNDVAKALNKIYEGLIEKGYKEEEADSIMREIFLLQIADNYRPDINKVVAIPHASVITVHNIHDDINFDYFDVPFDDNNTVLVRDFTDRDGLICLYRSFGEGSLSKELRREHTFKEDYVKAPILNSLIGFILIHAISDKKRLIDIINNKDVSALEQIIKALLAKAQEYIESKNKKIDDYSKDDLEALTNYLMIFIQEEFRRCIPYRPLQEDEKKEKDDRSKAINEYTNVHDLHYLIIDELFINLRSLINNLYSDYEKYNENDTIYVTLASNFPMDIPFSKRQYMLSKIKEIIKEKDKIVNKLRELRLPEDTSENLVIEQRNTIIVAFQKLKEIIRDERIINIINQYDSSITLS